MIEVRADDLQRLSKALKGVEPELRKALNKGVREAVRPAQKQAAAALADGLPAKLKRKKPTQRVQNRTGREPGVKVVVPFRRGGKGMGAANARLANRTGEIRHPLFGNRDAWYSTPVPQARGWFDRTYSDAAPDIRRGIEAAMEDVAREVVRKAGGQRVSS